MTPDDIRNLPWPSPIEDADDSSRRTGWIMACREIATRLAAEEADGREVVTREWLLSLGGERDEMPHPQKVVFRRGEYTADIGLWDVDDGWKVMLYHSRVHQTCILRGLKTRRAVLNLFGVLGIEAKGGA